MVGILLAWFGRGVPCVCVFRVFLEVERGLCRRDEGLKSGLVYGRLIGFWEDALFVLE